MDDDEVDCLSSVLGNFQLKNKLLGPILKKAYKNCLSYLFIYLYSFKKELIMLPEIWKNYFQLIFKVLIIFIHFITTSLQLVFSQTNNQN